MTSLSGSVISILLIVLGIYVAISVVAGHAGHMLGRLTKLFIAIILIGALVSIL